MVIIKILYFLALLGLSFYGLYGLVISILCLRARQAPLMPVPSAGQLPKVTIQIPIFNELFTLERLLKAVAALDYPANLLQVQVLNDSTDVTADLAAHLVSELNADGLDICHLKRSTRDGFKAGALAAGLETASGELVAILDADFIPAPNFLRNTVPFFQQLEVGCVQARWGHLNRNQTWLTRLEALVIDVFFSVEQVARSYSQLFLSFNGSAGIWRKTCLLDAGGWECDTLTEDLDLSYRAQLRGWKVIYLPDTVVPGELPLQMDAYKRQQARWARGSFQTARKLIGKLLVSEQPVRVRLAGSLHLLAYCVNIFVLVLVLLLPWIAIYAPYLIPTWLAPIILLAGIGPPLMVLVADVPGGPSPGERLLLLPYLLLVGAGLSLNNARAALKGLVSPNIGSFQRTPKFALDAQSQRWEVHPYALFSDRWMWMELVLSTYAFCGALLAGLHGSWGYVPWLALYGAGFAVVAGSSLVQAIRRRLAIHAQNAISSRT
jgi:cellulose synthase/poly-beta-1,6-N-acetylglucosamine synthase-like glycosyltransferase